MHKILLLIVFCFNFYVTDIFCQEEPCQHSLFDEKELLKHVELLSSDAFEGSKDWYKRSS